MDEETEKFEMGDPTPPFTYIPGDGKAAGIYVVEMTIVVSDRAWGEGFVLECPEELWKNGYLEDYTLEEWFEDLPKEEGIYRGTFAIAVHGDYNSFFPHRIRKMKIVEED